MSALQCAGRICPSIIGEAVKSKAASRVRLQAPHLYHIAFGTESSQAYHEMRGLSAHAALFCESCRASGAPLWNVSREAIQQVFANKGYSLREGKYGRYQAACRRRARVHFIQFGPLLRKWQRSPIILIQKHAVLLARRKRSSHKGARRMKW